MENRIETLKDGTKVTLRFLKTDDLEKLLEFYKALPFEDRKYLKVDVTKKEVVQKRLNAILERNAVRVIALHEDNIVAEGELFLTEDDWHRDQGEIRVIIAREFQRKGLGTIIMWQLYYQVLEHQIEHLVAKMMTPQTGFQNILKKFGFQEVQILPRYAKDQDNRKQDMLIMTSDMKAFSKVVTEPLKDGTKITLRLLTVNEDDLNKLMKFYQDLPFSDRKYLKVDVTKKDVVETRLHSIMDRRAVRVIALHEDNIVAEGELFLVGEDWHRDKGEIRVIVSRDFQRKGLGMILMRELYSQALNHKLEHLIAKMMTPQTGFQNILKKFGFKEEHVLPKYALDQDKQKQDMLIMACNMEDFWRELEGAYKQSDWQRCR